MSPAEKKTEKPKTQSFQTQPLASVLVTVQSLSPLLMHRFDLGAAEAVQASNNGESRPVAKSGNANTPRAVAERAAYKDEDNRLYWPATNLLSSIVDAGSFLKVGKKQLTTAKSTTITAGIFLEEPVFYITRPDGTDCEFEVDSRRIVNQNNGAAAICHRARIDREWQFSFTLQVDTAEFSLETARTLVDIAGSKIGIGAYRPRRRGPYGRFNVVSWREVTVSKAA